MTANEQDSYAAATAVYRITAETILREEQITLQTILNDADAAVKQFSLADSMLNLAGLYMVIDGVANALTNQKNMEALNEARKALYKSVIYLEKVVSSYIDAPYSDYSEQLEKITSISPAQRYFLVRKMGLAIDLLVNAFGDNTK